MILYLLQLYYTYLCMELQELGTIFRRQMVRVRAIVRYNCYVIPNHLNIAFECQQTNICAMMKMRGVKLNCVFQILLVCLPVPRQKNTISAIHVRMRVLHFIQVEQISIDIWYLKFYYILQKLLCVDASGTMSSFSFVASR